MSSSTSSTSSTSGVTGDYANGRYWGLASGLDVDSIVNSLIADKQEQIDKANQQKQSLEWKQTAYQTLISAFNTFQSTWLSSTGSSNILGSSTYAVYQAVSSNSAISVQAMGQVTGTSHTIQVTQSATAGSITGGSLVTPISGTISESDGSWGSNLVGTSLSFIVDGVSKTVSFTQQDIDSAGGSAASVAALMQGKINAAIGIDKVSVTAAADGKFTIDSNLSYSSYITVTKGGDTDALAKLGIDTSRSNRLSLGSTLSEAFGFSGGTVTVNGVSVALGGNDTISTAMGKINTSGAGVRMSYSSVTNSIGMTAADTGASTTISLGTDSVSRTFFQSVFAGSGTAVNGQDAIFTLDGVGMTRSANSFTIDGLNYTINARVDSSDASTVQKSTVTLTQDVSSAVKSITDFVGAYNALLDTVYAQLNQKPDADYQPLTDSQKEQMSDDEIAKWNDKAQEGLLYNDSALTSVLSSMRRMMYQPVTTSDGSTLSLYQIGITTTDDIYKGGELKIDTDKLTQALQNNPTGVQELFTKQSSTYYHLQMDGQDQRKTQEGLAYRLQDVISDATSTGVYPYVGSLIKIAGTENDASTDYTLNRQLKDIDDQITEYQRELTDKKDRLYSQFTTLETFLSQMNSQSALLTSFLNTGSDS